MLVAPCVSKPLPACAQAWELSGDVFATHKGDKPWISEMYGYIFAAAQHGMWHRVDRVSMLYPGYVTRAPPRLLHYGLEHAVETTAGRFAFDKHWHYQFDAAACPRGPTLRAKAPGGLFRHPPSPRELLPSSVRALEPRVRAFASARLSASANAQTAALLP